MGKTLKTIVRLPTLLGKGLIKVYQVLLRPLVPSSCRFYPTCSEYTFQAIDKYGLIKGSFLGARRISRCHGGNPGGVDELK